MNTFFTCLLLALFLGTDAVRMTPEPRQLKAHGWIIESTYNLDTEWEKFKDNFKRKFATSEDEEERRGIFENNMARANKLNTKQIESGGKPVFGVTKFADTSQEEFDRKYKGRKGNGHLPDGWETKNLTPKAPGSTSTNVTKIDWTEAGYVTPVKNQGQCGSCWAHSATEQIESQWMIQAGQSMWDFSVQQVTSCTTGALGCGGGDTTTAYDSLISGTWSRLRESNTFPGLSGAAQTPYTQSMYDECLTYHCTESCTDSDDGVGDLDLMETEEYYEGFYAKVEDYSYATPACTGACDDQSLTTLNANIVDYGPPSVCVNAAEWSLYVSGVMTTSACGGYAYDDLDHCVQLTGFDLDADEPYYMVRNSWSTNWGLDGYIYLSADDNTCGIADEATIVRLVDPSSYE